MIEVSEAVVAIVCLLTLAFYCYVTIFLTLLVWRVERMERNFTPPCGVRYARIVNEKTLECEHEEARPATSTEGQGPLKNIQRLLG